MYLIFFLRFWSVLRCFAKHQPVLAQTSTYPSKLVHQQTFVPTHFYTNKPVYGHFCSTNKTSHHHTFYNYTLSQQTIWQQSYLHIGHLHPGAFTPGASTTRRCRNNTAMWELAPLRLVIRRMDMSTLLEWLSCTKGVAFNPSETVSPCPSLSPIQCTITIL